VAVEDEGPPIGLSEDEAYDPPRWVKPVLKLVITVMPILPFVLIIIGVPLVAGADAATKVWSFWGDTRVLGALLLVAALLFAGGILLLLKRNDDSLALLTLGLIVFEGTMFWAVLGFQGSNGQWLFLLVMLAPLAVMACLQSSEVRRYWFVNAEAGDEPG
jgi:hypothetical protein